jgi:hypothetical protein
MIISVKEMTEEKLKNPWTPQDEGDHYPIMKEWWTIETIFKTKSDNRKWNLISSFSYKMEDSSSFFQYVLFDITSNKYVAHKECDDAIEKLYFRKNKLDLKYEKSSLYGLYPEYHIHIEDEKEDLIADMKYEAKSLPHWVAQNKTNGYLPIGLNYYRYGFLPNCNLKGTLDFKGKSYEIEGKGYIEHAYGNWSYKYPFLKIQGLRKTISIYAKLGKWWLSQNKIRIPRSISFSTENNVFGYDWIWGIADNNWSLFFGNSMFWINEGPSFGALYVTRNGKNYMEFANVRFFYNKLIRLEKYDIYYPCDMELIGKLDDKKIHMHFWKTTDSYEYIDRYDDNKFYKAWVICEMPGKMEGIYSDRNDTLKLKGDCKIVPLRIPSALGHNSLKFNILLPPMGLGVDVNFNSHFLNKDISTKLRLAPKPCFKFNIKKLKKEEFSNMDLVNI